MPSFVRKYGKNASEKPIPAKDRDNDDDAVGIVKVEHLKDGVSSLAVFPNQN